MSHCGFCTDLKEFLIEKGIDFIEKDISNNENKKEFIELNGYAAPYTIIKDGTEIVAKIVGLKPNEILDVVG